MARADTFETAKHHLAAAIRAHRQALGISQAQLAVRLQVAYSYISLMERAERMPSYETIVALADALKTTPGELCRAPNEKGDPVRDLVAFARQYRLTRRQIDELIAAGRSLFRV